jgi:hypothetical protein
VRGHGFDFLRGVVIGAVIWHKKNRFLLRKLLLLRQITTSLIATEPEGKRPQLFAGIYAAQTPCPKSLATHAFALARPLETVWHQGFC